MQLLTLVISFCKLQVFRHGPRTPADTYPTDPHVNQTFYPYGWGHITNVSNGATPKMQKKETIRTTKQSSLLHKCFIFLYILLYCFVIAVFLCCKCNI